ncbi:MAG: dihydrofolate reductase [Flavobacteriales bacterium]|nr:dihydrofolate reductase [Flavobacteriales bacterium]
MIVSSIAAIAANHAIGKDNDLIWDLPDDMRFFMTKTKGHFVIMGRKNYESIPEKYRPLKGRTNVIVTRSNSYEAQGAVVVNTLEEALANAKEAGEVEAYVIGGGQIYSLALEKNLVDRMYITHVHAEFEADAFYPEFDAKKWDAEILLEHPKDEKHDYAFTIIEYNRKR